MSKMSFLTANAWPDEDGKHVWVAHDCDLTGRRDVSMLPWPTWHIGEGQVEPSFSCDCGIHYFVPFGTPEKAEA